MMGKDTASPIHAHEYVESFIAHDACVDLTNLFAYGSSDSTVDASEITDQELATKLKIGDPTALDPPIAPRAVDPEPRRLPARLG